MRGANSVKVHREGRSRHLTHKVLRHRNGHAHRVELAGNCGRQIDATKTDQGNRRLGIDSSPDMVHNFLRRCLAQPPHEANLGRPVLTDVSSEPPDPRREC